MAFTVPTLLGVDNGGNSDEYTAWGYVNALLNAANYGQLQGFKNRLINGAFGVNQRVASSNADDTYAHDRWYVLTQTGAIACSTLTNPETGAITGIRLTQSQASAQRMGLAQIIESSNCRDLRSTIATLAGRVRLSASADVRYAVLEWTGTADSVTSDVVNDWTSASYTAGGFFISSNVNVLAVGEVACTAATWRALDALNATIGASMTNIIVMVWTEGTVAQNVTLDLNRMQFEPGATATTFEYRPYTTERALCQRYYEKSFAEGTAPAQNTGLFAGDYIFPAPLAGANSQRLGTIGYSVIKRTTPTITIYNPAAANSQLRDYTASADCSSTSASANGFDCFNVTATGNASTSAGNALRFHWTSEAEL